MANYLIPGGVGAPSPGLLAKGSSVATAMHGRMTELDTNLEAYCVRLNEQGDPIGVSASKEEHMIFLHQS